MKANNESLCLKWGTLKHWDFHSDKAKKLLDEYFGLGRSSSVMLQKDTTRQKQIICELIDLGDFETICLDWEDKEVSKEEAKKYVMEYGR